MTGAPSTLSASAEFQFHTTVEKWKLIKRKKKGSEKVHTVIFLSGEMRLNFACISILYIIGYILLKNCRNTGTDSEIYMIEKFSKRFQLLIPVYSSLKLR